MELTTSSLQEIINKKAKLKAQSEIEVLVRALNVSGILNVREIYVQEGDKKRELCFSLDDMSFKIKENILTILYEKKLSKYIISETEDFVKKVQLLSEQADNLLNITENL